MVAVAILAQAVEYFDFFVFATASAIFLGPLFFSGLSGPAATLASFATFAVGFVARPLGGAVAGHYGDKLGRKPVLVASNLLMGVSTFVIGLLPTAAAIGWAAPIILIALRILQGFALGGQWGGASLLLTESSPLIVGGSSAASFRSGRAGTHRWAVELSRSVACLHRPADDVVGMAHSLSERNRNGRDRHLYPPRDRRHPDVPSSPEETCLERTGAPHPDPAPIVGVIKSHWRTILLAGGAFVLPNAVAFIIVSGVLNYGGGLSGSARGSSSA